MYSSSTQNGKKYMKVAPARIGKKMSLNFLLPLFTTKPITPKNVNKINNSINRSMRKFSTLMFSLWEVFYSLTNFLLLTM